LYAALGAMFDLFAGDLVSNPFRLRLQGRTVLPSFRQVGGSIPILPRIIGHQDGWDPVLAHSKLLSLSYRFASLGDRPFDWLSILSSTPAAIQSVTIH
jgi:hypothetical protein